MSIIDLDFLDLAIATLLVVVAGLVSFAMRLRLERRLLFATVRTVVQLLLVGYLLTWVFGVDHPLLLAAVMTVMIVAASRAALDRSGRTFPGARLRSLFTLMLTATATTFAVTEFVVGVEPWYRPQYVIPLLGMVLGNGLTGLSLCLDHLLETLDQERLLVEGDLAMGATRWEAAREPLRRGVTRGMIPILNAMAVVGIVSLPGMMTGQILSGTDPLTAVKYQIVVMFMLAAGTALSCMLMSFLVYQALFDAQHRLRAETIRRKHVD
ncbi:MAG: iron export ABC transporter permease subunit FetB [Myxococcota bacterium]